MVFTKKKKSGQELADQFVQAFSVRRRKEASRSRHNTDEQLQNRQACEIILFTDFGTDQQGAANTANEESSDSNQRMENEPSTSASTNYNQPMQDDSSSINDNPPADNNARRDVNGEPLLLETVEDILYDSTIREQLLNSNEDDDCDFLGFNDDCKDLKLRLMHLLISSNV